MFFLRTKQDNFFKSFEMHKRMGHDYQSWISKWGERLRRGEKVFELTQKRVHLICKSGSKSKSASLICLKVPHINLVKYILDLTFALKLTSNTFVG